MPVPCARCDSPLPKWELATGDTAVCTECGTRNMVSVFPAAFGSAAPAAPDPALEGEAACFDHPAKRAVAACSQCGRFVCKLCAVEFGGETWCPSCVALGAGKAQAARPVTSRTLYDSIALAVPAAAIIFYPFMIVAAPASLVLTALRWKRPLSLVRRWRWRFLLAIVLSVAEVALWVAIVWVMLATIRKMPPPGRPN
jgi:hypothetical protein